MSIEELYRENYNYVYGYLLTLTKNHNLAEELTADTFFKAIEHIHQYNGIHKISSWLCQIAKHEYFRYYKNHKRICDLSDNDDIPFTDKKLEDIFIDKALTLQIHKLLHDLKEPYKEVFNLRVFAELSFSDIGSILNQSENWARVTFYRAKLKLLQQMEVD